MLPDLESKQQLKQAPSSLEKLALTMTALTFVPKHRRSRHPTATPSQDKPSLAQLAPPRLLLLLIPILVQQALPSLPLEVPTQVQQVTLKLLLTLIQAPLAQPSLLLKILTLAQLVPLSLLLVAPILDLLGQRSQLPQDLSQVRLVLLSQLHQTLTLDQPQMLHQHQATLALNKIH